MGSLLTHNSSTGKRIGKRLRRSLLILFSLLLLIRLFFLVPARVVSSSMFPALHVGDIILADKTSYGLRLPVTNTRIFGTGLPHRGDVVLFIFPGNKKQVYLKRIIGLPGDIVTLEGRQVFVNGKRISVEQGCMEAKKGAGAGPSPAVPADCQGEEILSDMKYTVLYDKNDNKPGVMQRFLVRPNHYFVLGDNRDHSVDSRSWGFVPEQNLIGRPFIILFSWNKRINKVAWHRVGMHVH